MEIIKLPFYIVIYAARFVANSVSWIGYGLMWIASFAAIGAAYWSISYIAESYVPATIIYAVLGVGAFIQWRFDLE